MAGEWHFMPFMAFDAFVTCMAGEWQKIGNGKRYGDAQHENKSELMCTIAAQTLNNQIGLKQSSRMKSLDIRWIFVGVWALSLVESHMDQNWRTPIQISRVGLGENNSYMRMGCVGVRERGEGKRTQTAEAFL